MEYIDVEVTHFIETAHLIFIKTSLFERALAF